jgi:hypothetical protein
MLTRFETESTKKYLTIEKGFSSSLGATAYAEEG